jgi:hypothetical protein
MGTKPPTYAARASVTGTAGSRNGKKDPHVAREKRLYQECCLTYLQLCLF